MFALSTGLKVALVAVLLFVIVVNIRKGPGLVRVKSSVDGRFYKVLNRTDNAQAADMLATLNGHLKEVVRHMYAKYPGDKDVATLYNRYRADALMEGAFDTKHTSYSINKGERIVLCIRQSNGDFVNMNTLLYVALHELAHVMTPTVGHDTLFWNNMQRVVKNATMYKPVDYSKRPAKYCGINITSSV